MDEGGGGGGGGGGVRGTFMQGNTICRRIYSDILMWYICMCDSWLRHCATSRKVAGSRSEGVTGIFHWLNPYGRTMTLGSTRPLTETNTRNISWGVKAAGGYGWQPYHLHVSNVLKSGNINLLEPYRSVIGLLRDWFTLNQYVKADVFGEINAEHSAVSRAVRHTAARNIHDKTRLTDPRNITYSTYPGIKKNPVTEHKRRM
jgi:hypothetical protein